MLAEALSEYTQGSHEESKGLPSKISSLEEKKTPISGERTGFEEPDTKIIQQEESKEGAAPLDFKSQLEAMLARGRR